MDILKKMPDETLIEMYRSGNDEAFDALLHRHKNRLFSYILFIVKDHDEADDLFQETFVRAIMRIKQGKYSESGSFHSWITRIAHNLIIDKYRSDKNMPTVSNDDEDHPSDLFVAESLLENTREDEMVHEQVLADVVSLINTLPLQQQQVVRMRFYEDLSFKEIAEKQNISINTALGRLRYALLNMRRTAKEKGVSLNFN